MPYDDYPLEECAETLEPFLEKGASFYQKWTCQHCRSRQTMAEPNKLFRAGICEECGQSTVIKACNYMLVTGSRGLI